MHLRVSFNIHYSKGLFNRKCTGNMNMKSREAVDYNAELRRCLLKALLNVQVRHSSRPNVEKNEHGREREEGDGLISADFFQDSRERSIQCSCEILSTNYSMRSQLRINPV